MTLLHLALPGQFEVPELMAQDTTYGKGYFFSGHGAAWSKDLGNNVLQKGCFLPSIQAKVDTREIKIRWMHENPMGFVTEAHEDDTGLWIRAFVPSTTMNDERIMLMKSGVVDKLSIGFDPDFSSIEISDGTRKIGKLDLYEVSPVDLPLNPDTDIETIVETMRMHQNRKEESFEPKRQFLGATLSAANISLLRTAQSNITKVLDSASKDTKEEDSTDEKDNKENKDSNVEETFDDKVFGELFTRFDGLKVEKN